MEIHTDNLTKTENYIICLIRCLMWDQPVPPVPQDLPCRQLLDFSRRHSIEALVLRGLHSLDRNGQIDAQWQTRTEGRLCSTGETLKVTPYRANTVYPAILIRF